VSDDSTLRIARPDAPLGERVVAAIREAISIGALVPGQRLTEREMMERTGVSRTSVREAFRELQALGLVERAPKGGLRVAVLDRPVIEHIYEARSAIETAAAELFVQKATEEEFAELARIGERHGTDIVDDLMTPSLAYDEILLRGAHNPILTEMVAPLHTRIQGLRRLSLSMPGRIHASRAEIREIIDAVLARNAESAAAASRRHIAAAAKSALEAADQAAIPADGAALK
jgi:DNA-binding GntR family transcriptional regulator